MRASYEFDFVCESVVVSFFVLHVAKILCLKNGDFIFSVA